MRSTPTPELLRLLKPIEIRGELPASVSSITQDSRLVREGSLFAVRAGSRSSGFEYVHEAVSRGASLLMTAEPLPNLLPIPAIRVSEFRPALVAASHHLNGYPSRALGLIGLTGTNGKTSAAHLTRSIFEAGGDSCAMLTTVDYWTGKRMIDAPLTTPDIDRICDLLRESVESGCRWGVMEVSSHALDQGRVHGLKFKAAAFTNLTQDHLDYHKTFAEYFDAKMRLFKALPINATAIVNISQPWGARVVKAAWGCVVTVGGEFSGADLTFATIEHTVRGACYRLSWQGREVEVRTPLIGIYQGENIALAAATALSCEIPLEQVALGIEALQAVPGRMEAVSLGQPFAVLVDYSHTPDALLRGLTSLRPLTGGKLIALFGCGGDRDRSKRPMMGRIASEHADLVFITSDNPRTEIPLSICKEIEEGVPVELSHKVNVIVDRREATNEAIKKARAGDILLLAGKGSETYIEVNGMRSPYDDRVVAADVLRNIGHRPGEVVH